MSNIPNLGEYGFIPPVTEIKSVAPEPTSNIKQSSKKYSVVSKPKPIIPSIESPKEEIDRPVKTQQSVVDKEEEYDSKQENESSKNYIKYPIIGLLLLIGGILVYYLFSKFKKGKNTVHEITTEVASTGVVDCLPIPTEIYRVDRNNYNPFLKIRTGYFPNSSYYVG